MRNSFAFCALLACIASHLAAAGPVESSVWIEVSRESGVMFNGNSLPIKGEGAGVAISMLEVTTATHVVWRAKEIRVLHGSLLIPAEIVRVDKDLDLAILRVKEQLPHFAATRSTPVASGELVSVVGRPLPNETPQLFSANVLSVNWPSNGVPVPLIFSGIKGEKGQSGGGLFDASGQLVGIIIRIDRRLGYLSALPVTSLCRRFQSRCPAFTEEYK